MKDRTLQNMQKRLERWELKHLREHAAALAVRLEKAEKRAQYAEDAAEFWHDQAMNIKTALDNEECVTHQSIGITKTGDLLVIRHEA